MFLMPDLFDYASEQLRKSNAPLAARMRPQTLDELVGQEEIVGKGRLLRRSIEADNLSSLIFFGPPGCGKTTLAQIIANTTKSYYASLSAVTAGIADVRLMIKDAQERLKLYGQRTVLFIDEIHRFNKTQQDALLPAVEEGVVILIGATTENPYFEVNRALLSRSRIFRLQPLSVADIAELLKRALIDKERGFGNRNIEVDEDILRFWAGMSGGDARTGYNALELAVMTTPPDAEGICRIDHETAEESIQRKIISYDKSGDWHYDVISAFIKSMRGSDPDAAVHWLARMIEAGEKPEFIARRIVICAAEDVGLADPQALVVAMTAANAVNFVGWPEARLPLAQAVLYIATAPKSNSVLTAIDSAQSDLKDKPFGGVPLHLRDSNPDSAKNFGHGKNYKYPHSYENNYVEQQYLPDELIGAKYYKAGSNDRESRLADRLEIIKKNKKQENKK